MQKNNLTNKLQKGDFLRLHIKYVLSSKNNIVLPHGYYYAILLGVVDNTYPARHRNKKLYLFANYIESNKHQIEIFPTSWELIYTYECFIKSVDNL